MPHNSISAEIPATGAWAIDITNGRALAADYLARARAENNPVVLTGALRAMAEGGQWTGVEVGFAFALAQATIR